MTAATGLLDWLEAPRDDRAIVFARDDGSWERRSYAELAGLAGGAAAQLRDGGVPAGGIVSIVVPTGPLFLAAYFGALLIGATPAPLVPPTLFEDLEAYATHTAALVRAAGGPVVTTPALAETVGHAVGQAGAPAPIVIDEVQREPRFEQPAELALLQFTSGSTGRPRGVRVSWTNLERNIAMIRDWIDWGPDDVGAHWLPLYHDMGLIGCTLTPAIHQREVWIMRPEQFIRDPRRWLQRFADGAHLTASPSFGFAYANRRVPAEALDGADFSSWRVAILGAERLDAGALARFARAMAPHGFRPETYLPAYGLAECTLAATGLAPGRVARAVRPDWSALRFGAPVAIAAAARIDAPEIGDGAGWVLGCGAALAPTRVTVLDASGDPVADGCLGELHVQGPTVAGGYLGDEQSPATQFVAGGVCTGDAGFVWDGELFVVGRLGDAIKVRGRTIYAEDLEAKLSVLPGLPKGRIVVVPGLDGGDQGLTVIVEAEAGAWLDPALALLRSEAGSAIAVRVLTGAPGLIPRTSSGKPRRRVLWQQLAEGAEPPGLRLLT